MVPEQYCNISNALMREFPGGRAYRLAPRKCRVVSSRWFPEHVSFLKEGQFHEDRL